MFSSWYWEKREEKRLQVIDGSETRKELADVVVRWKGFFEETIEELGNEKRETENIVDLFLSCFEQELCIIYGASKTVTSSSYTKW